MDVTIYTTTGCGACQQAKAFLTQHDVSFVERNLATDSVARDELVRLGFRVVPVIRVGSEAMSGFDPVKLGKLVGV